VKTTFNNAIDEMGPLCLFINCAGMGICGNFKDVSTNDIMVFLIFNIKIMLNSEFHRYISGFYFNCIFFYFLSYSDYLNVSGINIYIFVALYIFFKI